MSRVSAEFIYVSEYIFVSEFLYVSEINCIFFQGGVKCSAFSRKVICIFIQMLSPNNPRNVIESHGAEHILMNRVPKIFINRAAFSKCRGSSPVVLEMRGLFVNFANIILDGALLLCSQKNKMLSYTINIAKGTTDPGVKCFNQINCQQLAITCDNCKR